MKSNFAKLLLTASVIASLSETALANIVGSDLQNFNATTSGLDFVTVHSSETLVPGVFNLGLFSTYGVNTLPRFDGQGKGRRIKIYDSLLTSDFNAGMGLMKSWDIGISLPNIIHQKVNKEGSYGLFEQNGLTEVRVNSKVRLYGDNEGGVAFIVSANHNLTSGNPYTGIGSHPTLNFEIAADTTVADIALGVNVGYRKKNSGKSVADFPGAPLADQYLLSAAASYRFTSIDTKIIGEYFSAFPVEKTSLGTARSLTASELLIGLKHDLTNQLALHGGFGTETRHGTSSADWRVYAGLNYSFGTERKTITRTPAKPAAVAKPKPNYIPKPAKQLEVLGGDEVFALHNINFAFDTPYLILAEGRAALDELAAHLRKRGFKRMVVEGHTDSLGDAVYNQKLGQQRATAIITYLSKFGNLDSSALSAVSYGETRPIADNGNYQGRDLNRRVVFRIFY